RRADDDLIDLQAVSGEKPRLLRDEDRPFVGAPRRQAERERPARLSGRPRRREKRRQRSSACSRRQAAQELWPLHKACSSPKRRPRSLSTLPMKILSRSVSEIGNCSTISLARGISGVSGGPSEPKSMRSMPMTSIPILTTGGE